MMKRILSAVLGVALVAAMGLATVGCNNEPDVVVEEHEDINTTKVKESNLRVD